MTSVPASSATPSASWLAARACLLGGAVAAAVFGAGAVLGLFPEGLGGWVVVGAGLGAATGGIGLALQTWLSTLPADHPQVVQRYLMGLILPFALQALVVTVACLTLWATGVESEAAIAVGLSFAVAATALGVTGVVVVSRSMRTRTAPSVARAP